MDHDREPVGFAKSAHAAAGAADAMPGGVPAASAAVLPEPVARLAAERGLGELLDVRHEVPATTALLRGGVTAIVSGALLGAVSAFAADESIFSVTYSLLRFVGLAFFFTMVGGIIYALRGLIVGSRAHYLFSRGLVHQRRGGPVAVAWPEVEVFKALYNRRTQGSEGKVLGYQVVVGGRPVFAVPLALVDDRDAFMDRIIERLRAHGRPVQ